MSNYNQLKDVLNDIFELNKADLDFGIYRIMNQKRKQVNEFIEKQLPEDIKTALSETQSSDRTEIENELKTLKKNLDDAGIVAEDTPKYKSLSERLKTIDNSDSLEQEVFSHLANFFRRYYKDGDFISMRRYKKDVYAIPYEGEEVKLHWANHDQYYIKSSENFKNYTFKTGDGKLVHFQLKEVSTEQNNNKSQGDAERRFSIYAELPLEENGNELIINFIYEPVSKATKQETLINEAIELLSTIVPSAFISVFALSPTEKNTKRTLLEKHVVDFVSKNSFDYFIHKDLGGFLNRELDFYIKNEVLYLDDVNTKQTEFFVAQLSKVKAIRAVSQKIIEFLAQIENFQKKLWLKKKFVISSDYCITLDKIPSEYYPEIINNKEQLAEWKILFDVNIHTAEQLVFEPFLVLDTKFFDLSFKDRLLSEFDNLDEQTNGLLINSDNFQGLNILLNKFESKLDCVYIDPPYNTSELSFNYKNLFRHGSWISMMENRITLSKGLMKDNAALINAIDDEELYENKLLLDSIFTSENYISTIVLQTNPRGRSINGHFATSHDYLIFYGKNKELVEIVDQPLTDEQKLDFKHSDPNSEYRLLPFRRSGGLSTPADRPNSEFTIYYSKTIKKIIGVGGKRTDDYPSEYNSNTIFIYHNSELKEIKKNNIEQYFNNQEIIEINPIDSEGKRRVWRWSDRDKIMEFVQLGDFIVNEGNKYSIQLKDRIKDGRKPKTMWYDSKYDASSHGTILLENILGRSKQFGYPKSIHNVYDSIFTIVGKNKDGVVIDYFAGSGTTAHATIKLNQQDRGNRKYIMIEMGSYFNTVTKPRIQKVIYSENWKNGKPQDKTGISQIFKYQLIESYEDTLNNLYLQNNVELDFTGKAKEEYLLQYMLELESRDHLFNLEMFRKPFDYQLKVTENNELKPTKVDLVETFNYLIGLYVNKVQRVKDIKVVEGTTRTGIKTLVIWRDLETTTHEEVEKLLRRFYDSQRTKEFHQIYINGDHHLENLRSEGDQFKIKLIEETFFKKMFNEIEL